MCNRELFLVMIKLLIYSIYRIYVSIYVVGYSCNGGIGNRKEGKMAIRKERKVKWP
jgi:hypothetical protein